MNGKDSASMGSSPWMYQHNLAGQGSEATERDPEPQPYQQQQPYASSQQSSLTTRTTPSYQFDGGPTEPRSAEASTLSSRLHYQSQPNQEYANHLREEGQEQPQQAQINPEQYYDVSEEVDSHPYHAHYQYHQHLQQQQQDQYDDANNMYHNVPNQMRPPELDYSGSQQSQSYDLNEGGPSSSSSMPFHPTAGLPTSSNGPNMAPPMPHHTNSACAPQMSSQQGPEPAQVEQWAHPPYPNMFYTTNAPVAPEFHRQRYPSSQVDAHHNEASAHGQQHFNQGQYPPPPHPFYNQSVPNMEYPPPRPHPRIAVSVAPKEMVASPAFVSKEPPKKKSKLSKVPRNADRPKRPLSAYNIFFKDERAKMIARTKIEEDEEDRSSEPGVTGDGKPVGQSNHKRKKKKRSGIGFAEMAQAISEQWKRIDEKTLAKYKEKATADMQRYRKERDEFNLKQELKEQEEWQRQQQHPENEDGQEKEDKEDDKADDGKH